MEIAWQLEDTRIGVQRSEAEGQQIWLQATAQGERLAQFLADEEAPPRQDGYIVVEHTAEVDGRLCTLLNALTAVRWAHPTYTQLVLCLPETQGGEG
jgi:hypothetical protein